MNWDLLLSCNEILADIIHERQLGKSNKQIHYELKSKYPSLSRSNVTEYLRSIGSITSTGHGGYRFSAGRGISYCYDGIVLDSFGEFVVYLYYKSLGIKLQKCTIPIKVDNYQYTPDFYDGYSYYEVKCYSTDDFYGWNYNKLRNIKYPLKVITSEELHRMRNEISYPDEWFSQFITTGWE